MERKKFFELLGDKTNATKAKAGKADWDAILAEMAEDGGIYTTTQVWNKFVKRVVKKMNVREHLHDLYDKGKMARIHQGIYSWSANPDYVKEQHKDFKGE